MYSIQDLLHLMSRLRDPASGCEWDLAQTPNSIINYSIEEIYELADAIESADSNAIKNELGDVLFQVVFFAKLAEENNQYDFTDIVNGLCEKLIRRHPHIFVDGKLHGVTANLNGIQNTAQQSNKTVWPSKRDVAKNWEQIKQRERDSNQQSGLFDDVPNALPVLLRAAKLQKRAKTIGLDWPTASGALTKLKEELVELEQAMLSDSNTKHADIEEELGDLLFSCVNVARQHGINSEQALRLANKKFTRRALHVSKQLQDKHPQTVTANKAVDPAVLENYWQITKQATKPS